MKQKDGGEPKDDGQYALRRATVLEVLTRHYFKIGRDRESEELYLLERDGEFFYESLPPLIPSEMIFRLALTFKIPPEEFHEANREGLH